MDQIHLMAFHPLPIRKAFHHSEVSSIGIIRPNHQNPAIFLGRIQVAVVLKIEQIGGIDIPEGRRIAGIRGHICSTGFIGETHFDKDIFIDRKLGASGIPLHGMDAKAQDPEVSEHTDAGRTHHRLHIDCKVFGEIVLISAIFFEHWQRMNICYLALAEMLYRKSVRARSRQDDAGAKHR